MAKPWQAPETGTGWWTTWANALCATLGWNLESFLAWSRTWRHHLANGSRKSSAWVTKVAIAERMWLSDGVKILQVVERKRAKSLLEKPWTSLPNTHLEWAWAWTYKPLWKEDKGSKSIFFKTSIAFETRCFWNFEFLWRFICWDLPKDLTWWITGKGIESLRLRCLPFLVLRQRIWVFSGWILWLMSTSNYLIAWKDWTNWSTKSKDPQILASSIKVATDTWVKEEEETTRVMIA